MNKKDKKLLYIAVFMFAAFAAWTTAICFIDVKSIGPYGSYVGLSTLNKFVHESTGTNMLLYTITDWAGLAPVGTAFGFAVFGLTKWIKRKKFLCIDKDILFLGVFYLLVITAYILFEVFVINYRPILIDGYLEASYPSSTTMLSLCIMLTTIFQFRHRIRNKKIRRWLIIIVLTFTVFMVAGRSISGVHWFTDIAGGILLSLGLVYTYCYISNIRIAKS